MLIEGIAAIMIAVWIIQQGMGPGDSIMIVLGLPVLLFGVVLTIIGLAKSTKKAAPVATHLDRSQQPEKHEKSR
jgi:multisubunit Na+/H+ antiporter MnhC subunit